MFLICALAPPSFEIKTRSQTALKGESTVLQCEAKGEKPIGILWNMNNKRIDGNTDPRYTVRSEASILNGGYLYAYDDLYDFIAEFSLLMLHFI